MPAYATAADLSAWVAVDADIPDDAARMLTRASMLVDQYVRSSYDVDAAGAATDADVAAALRDATCAVVEGWIEAGEENDLDGLAGTQMGVPGYSGPRAVALAPRAYRLLAQAGLTQLSDTSAAW